MQPPKFDTGVVQCPVQGLPRRTGGVPLGMTQSGSGGASFQVAVACTKEGKGGEPAESVITS
jgi:hypothetical protein